MLRLVTSYNVFIKKIRGVPYAPTPTNYAKHFPQKCPFKNQGGGQMPLNDVPGRLHVI